MIQRLYETIYSNSKPVNNIYYAYYFCAHNPIGKRAALEAIMIHLTTVQ